MGNKSVDDRGVRIMAAAINKYGITHKRDKDGLTEKILKIELEIAGPQVDNAERELIRLNACEPVSLEIFPIQLELPTK